MQQNFIGLRGNDIAARDGNLGHVKDAYFDDRGWAVRYLVVDTGGWLTGRKVLISPNSVDQADPEFIHVALTREQVENAPSIDADKPVSRLYGEAHASYYGYPFVWPMGVPTAAPLSGVAAAQTAQLIEDMQRKERALEEQAGETHLRSAGEVVGYRIEAADGELGHVEDFVIDVDRWLVDDVVVDTRNWLPGRKVLLPPSAIAEIDWPRRRVKVRLSRSEVEELPEAR